MMWQKRILGGSSPEILVRTLLYLNTKNFGIRGRANHRSLRFKQCQIAVQHCENGDTHLKYTDDDSQKSVVQYQNKEHPERCHVALFQKYIFLCPQTGEGYDQAFYLRPKKAAPMEAIWYWITPLGVNTISKLMGLMAQEAGLEGNFSFASITS